jgi:plastocyanin
MFERTQGDWDRIGWTARRGAYQIDSWLARLPDTSRCPAQCNRGSTIVERASRPARWVVLALSIVVSLSLAVGAWATGPGGWDHLGTGGANDSAALNGRVDVLLSVGHFGAIPDSVYAGGVFTSAGGNTSAVAVARWDGSAWHSIGAPPLSTATGAGIDAIAVDPTTGKVYVGGNFTNAGGNAAADFLAVWDGVSWKPSCAPITANVKALKIVGRTLYIGGDFADGAGLASADKLVRCDLDNGSPSSTITAGPEINSAIYALTADSAGRLYAAGSFININGIPNADHVAMYDGAWHAMLAGAVDDITRSIASDGTNVYIGSDAVDIAGIAQADHVAKWNGTAWSALGANAATTDGWLPASTFINAIAVSGSNVFVAGSFQNADGHPTADMVAGFNGFSWAPMGSDGAGNGPLGAAANAVTVFGGQVVVGGNFTSAGADTRAAYVARYPGAAHPLTAVIRLGNGGFSPFVGSTASFDGTASDGDVPIVSYRWTFSDGTADSAGPRVAHLLTKQGQNVVTLIVTDSAGHTAQASEDFFIAGLYPQARFAWLPSTVFAGQSITFDGSASVDADGTIASYDWQWGDATSDSHNAKPTHVFATPGTYQVALFVLDDNTQSGAVIHNVTVVPLTVPAVSRVSMTNVRFRVGSGSTAIAAKAPRGTSFKFTLKAPGKVTIAICAHRKRCTRARNVGTLTRSKLQAGRNTIKFSGRIGRRALSPGAYRAMLSARNVKGTSKPVAVKFEVVR